MQSKPQCAHNAAGAAVAGGNRGDYCNGICMGEKPVERLPSGIQGPFATAFGPHRRMPFVNAQAALVKNRETVTADQTEIIRIVEKRGEIERRPYWPGNPVNYCGVISNSIEEPRIAHISARDPLVSVRLIHSQRQIQPKL